MSCVGVPRESTEGLSSENRRRILVVATSGRVESLKDLEGSEVSRWN